MRRFDGNVLPSRDPMMSETKRSQLPQIRASKYNVSAIVDTNKRKPMDVVAKMEHRPAATEPEGMHNNKKPVSKGKDFICCEVARRMNARHFLPNGRAGAIAAAANSSKTLVSFHNIQRLAQAKNVPKFEYKSDPRIQPVNVEKRARGCEIARLRIQTSLLDDPNVDLKTIPVSIWYLRLRLIYYEKCGGTRNDANQELKLAAAVEIMRKEFGLKMPDDLSLDIVESMQDKFDTSKALGAVEKKHEISEKYMDVANTDWHKPKEMAKKSNSIVQKPNTASSTYMADISKQFAKNSNSKKGKKAGTSIKMNVDEKENLLQPTKSNKSQAKTSQALSNYN